MMVVLRLSHRHNNHYDHPHDHDRRCKDIYAARGGSLTDKQICAGGQPGKVDDDDDGHHDYEDEYGYDNVDRWMMMAIMI